MDRLTVVAHFPEGDLDLRDFTGTLFREGDRLEIEAEEIGLPASQGSGQAELDWAVEGRLGVELGLDVAAVTFEDLGWLAVPLPEGIASGRLDARIDSGKDAAWSLTDLSAESGDSRASGVMRFATGGVFRFTEVSLDLDPVERSLLQAWLPDSFPTERLPERVTGRLEVEGPLNALETAATLSVPEPGFAPTRLEVRGRIVSGRDPRSRRASNRRGEPRLSNVEPAGRPRDGGPGNRFAGYRGLRPCVPGGPGRGAHHAIRRRRWLHPARGRTLPPD